MPALETSIFIVRFVGAGIIVLLVPGLLAVRHLRLTCEWPERLLFSCALSYCWLFVLALILPLAHLTIEYAGALTVILTVVLCLARRETLSMRALFQAAYRFSTERWAVVLLAIGLATLGWLIEPTITGEEALDLVGASRFSDGGVMTLDNASVMPNTRHIYLFQPYQLMIGAIARIAGASPLVAIVKLRALLVPLSAGLIYALIRRFTRTAGDAPAVLAVMLVVIGLDLPTWEFNSLFPLVRRGGFSAGINVPIVMALVLLASRQAHTRPAVAQRRLAMAVIPVMLLAALSTHPLEMFPVLCFAGAVAIAVLTRLDREGSAPAVLLVAVALASTVFAYALVQARGVPLVSDYESRGRSSLRSEFGQSLRDPIAFITGDMDVHGAALLTDRIPATTVGVAGVPALLLVAWASPASAAWLTLGIVPLAAAFATPGGYQGLALATSEATASDVNGYFALLGLLAVALGVLRAAQWLLQMTTGYQSGQVPTARRIALWAFGLTGLLTLEGWLTRWLLDFTQSEPRTAILLAAIVGATALIIGRSRANRPLAVPPQPVATLLLSMCLILPMAAANRGTALPAALAYARSLPSVLDWPRYYDHLRTTIAPPLPVPRAVVDTLQRSMPVRQVLLADPRYSCALVVLLDAYCINPERIYGHFFLSAQHYHDAYVRSDGTGTWHPFFNVTWPAQAGELTLLDEFGVDYVLAPPEQADLIERKLRAMSVAMSAMPVGDGFLLFKIQRPDGAP